MKLSMNPAGYTARLQTPAMNKMQMPAQRFGTGSTEDTTPEMPPPPPSKNPITSFFQRIV